MTERIEREFPSGVDTTPDGMSRREFMKLLGASIALAGLDGCTRMPAEKIFPYAHQPPEIVPGQALHFATTMVIDGYGTGLVVESHEGRPTKIEGNPEHPASLGAAGLWEQASVLQLYDPDRSRHVRVGGRATTWAAFANAFSPEQLRQHVGARGAGLHLLLEPSSSPLEGQLLARIRELYPDAGIHFHSAFGRSNASDAVDTGGARVIPQFDFSNADVIVSLGADFLGTMPFHLRYARQFADGRRLATPSSSMNRLYVAECSLSVTGAAADHRVRVRPDVLPRFAAALAGRVVPELSAHASLDVPSVPTAWLDAIARDLLAHAGRCVVVAGEQEPPQVHALAHAMNEALHNVGHTTWYTASPRLDRSDSGDAMRLADAVRTRSVDTLICIGGNPVYASPADLTLDELIRSVRSTAYVGLYEEETARACQWTVPLAHNLESWGDARAYDGTLSVVQPLVQPLFGAKSHIEVLSAIVGEPGAAPRELLESAWRQRLGSAPDAWPHLLEHGVLAGSESAPVRVSVRRELLDVSQPPSPRGTLQLALRPDAKVYDGRFANNAWLQEVPDPITKLTWDNAVELSPATARTLGVESADMLEVRGAAGTLLAPALVVPGHADGALTLRAGYGRTGAVQVARGVGTNAYRLWPSSAWSRGIGAADVVVARRAGDRHTLAITQSHWQLDGRDAARSTTLADYRSNPQRLGGGRRRALSLFEPAQSDPLHSSGQQWAMTIDLGTCIGCSGCVVACQAENNIPVVGRDDVANGREMHWMRIDRYLSGGDDMPSSVMQPMLCQHCEQAPCEYVCPVGATVHSPDGLNEMVYNRCVGTRFCSNNCPYKVRRFNWFDYSQRLGETEAMQKNPDVTVRERGVMEKCTFCVQRIREAEIAAARDGRPLEGRDVQTACQQACPTQAIVFGSLTDSESEMARRRAQSRAYAVLEHLGTEPRVRYLAAIRNPNPEMQGAHIT